MSPRHAAIALAAALTLTACGGNQDARIAYYDDHDGRGEIAYCVYPDDLPESCQGARDRDGNLIDTRYWFEVDDDDWNAAGLSPMHLFFLGHMDKHHGYYHSSKYRKHVPAAKWAAYKAKPVDRSKWEKNNSSTIRTFLKPAKSGGFKSSGKSSHRSSSRGRR